jgi:pseudaminic acid biosynthesis-associated methylase
MEYSTPQENFWAGKFGDEYINRNHGEELLTTKLLQFSRMLKRAPGIRSCIELGCNIGLNLAALKRFSPGMELTGYEINPTAAKIARQANVATIKEGTILEPISGSYDLSFTCGVLIHIHPDELGRVYANLHNLSSRYILVREYYNPTPVAVSYRGEEERLFKRDFAGEMMERYGLRLLDYGFCYRRDAYIKQQDDSCWFLMEKT